jgi:hypothetical protein
MCVQNVHYFKRVNYICILTMQCAHLLLFCRRYTLAFLGPNVHFTASESDFEMKKTITKGVEARELDLGSRLVLT